ncbi:hypothetical protein MIND_01112300 [Mycena indigotica]|uniref:Uncharacterized protein n=1 Tax=Mycena indigotica TaxID=2126181 RepID=A0A8H6SB70_9AGAR|nr:uncharacterized protein MIND_01112300 [Mycena indigotica]KAF7295718.1 hypothetical protein MIND_01112300 [Mycena indigotica]
MAANVVFPALVFLTVLSTLLNFGLLHRAYTLSATFSSPYNSDYLSPVAEIPFPFRTVVKTFSQPDSDYPLTNDDIWAAIVSPKRGFIRLGSAGDPVATALNHQLHCVNGIRFAYRATRDGLFRTDKQRADAFAHANHCFDLLRQSILCRADTSLVNGGETTRVCRDWDQIREFVDESHKFWEGVPYDYVPPAEEASKAKGYGE